MTVFRARAPELLLHPGAEIALPGEGRAGLGLGPGCRRSRSSSQRGKKKSPSTLNDPQSVQRNGKAARISQKTRKAPRAMRSVAGHGRRCWTWVVFPLRPCRKLRQVRTSTGGQQDHESRRWSAPSCRRRGQKPRLATEVGIDEIAQRLRHARRPESLMIGSKTRKLSMILISAMKVVSAKGAAAST